MNAPEFDSDKANENLRAYALAHTEQQAVLKSGEKVTLCRAYGIMMSDKCYHVLLDDTQIAEARLYGVHSGFLDLDKGVGNISRVMVEPSFQRLGVATALYDLIETDLARVNAVLEPSQSYALSDDAKGFWTNRLNGTTPQDYHENIRLKAFAKVLEHKKNPKAFLKRWFGQ